VYEVTAGKVTKHVWKPSDFGIDTTHPNSLKGGDSACNVQIILAILRGSAGPGLGIVLVNAAAGLLAAGLATDLRSGMELAARSVDSGAALGKLELLKKNFPAA
jgi:anthranilate phosphoribosyltransferase